MAIQMTGDVGVLSTPAVAHKADNRVKTSGLPPEAQEAVEADDFIIYGKASIEQYDDDEVPTLIEMDALEGALDRFFDSETSPGIISRHHQDIPIGRPLREYTLDEAVSVDVGDESYEFEAGETLETHVEDADGDGRPELWLVANIGNDTEIGKKSRLKALTGELSGYSVTVHRNRDENTNEGRKILECDLHAVTLGTDDQIKNKGSEFDVAEFKAHRLSEEQRELAEGLADLFDTPVSQAMEAVGTLDDDQFDALVQHAHREENPMRKLLADAVDKYGSRDPDFSVDRKAADGDLDAEALENVRKDIERISGRGREKSLQERFEDVQRKYGSRRRPR